MAYSTEADLLIGDQTTIAPAVKTQFVLAATDEIDTYVGQVYETPIDIVDPGSVDRSAALLIKKLAQHISTGRLLMSIDQAGEDNKPNAYAQYLLDDALATLRAIVDGDIVLPGAVPLQGPTDTSIRTNGALVGVLDPYSQVESFYGWAARRSTLVEPGSLWGTGGGSWPG